MSYGSTTNSRLGSITRLSVQQKDGFISLRAGLQADIDKLAEEQSKDPNDPNAFWAWYEVRWAGKLLHPSYFPKTLAHESALNLLRWSNTQAQRLSVTNNNDCHRQDWLKTLDKQEKKPCYKVTTNAVEPYPTPQLSGLPQGITNIILHCLFGYPFLGNIDRLNLARTNESTRQHPIISEYIEHCLVILGKTIPDRKTLVVPPSKEILSTAPWSDSPRCTVATKGVVIIGSNFEGFGTLDLSGGEYPEAFFEALGSSTTTPFLFRGPGILQSYIEVMVASEFPPEYIDRKLQELGEYAKTLDEPQTVEHHDTENINFWRQFLLALPNPDLVALIKRDMVPLAIYMLSYIKRHSSMESAKVAANGLLEIPQLELDAIKKTNHILQLVIACLRFLPNPLKLMQTKHVSPAIVFLISSVMAPNQDDHSPMIRALQRSLDYESRKMFSLTAQRWVRTTIDHTIRWYKCADPTAPILMLKRDKGQLLSLMNFWLIFTLALLQKRDLAFHLRTVVSRLPGNCSTKILFFAGRQHTGALSYIRCLEQFTENPKLLMVLIRTSLIVPLIAMFRCASLILSLPDIPYASTRLILALSMHLAMYCLFISRFAKHAFGRGALPRENDNIPDDPSELAGRSNKPTVDLLLTHGLHSPGNTTNLAHPDITSPHRTVAAIS